MGGYRPPQNELEFSVTCVGLFVLEVPPQTNVSKKQVLYADDGMANMLFVL